jgi:mxaJ protein
MCSAFLRALAVLALMATPAAARELRVCADPNNLPFSNERGEGFENRIAAVVADQLHAELHTTWWAQRRGFLRNTLGAGRCDVVAGTLTGLDMLRTTSPYYRSGYVFVTRAADGLDIASLDDPRLHTLRVGVQLIGDDGMNTPPAHALSKRGITGNVRGYTVYGDYAQASPAGRIVAAIAQGEVDVAIVWGPFAGYFAGRQGRELTLRVRHIDGRAARG